MLLFQERSIKNKYDSNSAINGSVLYQIIKSLMPSHQSFKVFRYFSSSTEIRSANFLNLYLNENNKISNYNNYHKKSLTVITENNQKTFNITPVKLNSNNNVEIPKLISKEEQELRNFEFIKNILTQRKNAAIKISNFIKNKLHIIKMKKKIILKKLLKMRREKIKKIQAVMKGIFVRKEIKLLLQNDFVFLYQMDNTLVDKLALFNKTNDEIKNNSKIEKVNKIDNIKIQIFSHQFKMKKFKFIYNKPLKTYYLPIKKVRVLKRQFKVNFYINDILVIDPRFGIDFDSKGNFFNIILKSMIIKINKNSSFSSVQNIQIDENNNNENRDNEEGYWESIFHLKRLKRANSFDSISISNSNVSNNNEVANNPIVSPPKYESEIANKTDIKPILKKTMRRIESCNKSYSNRKVSFNNKIMISY
jgi:hypothetical protein